jgi:cyclophilin family peptidyl-prolyl cis-trans isomerase
MVQPRQVRHALSNSTKKRSQGRSYLWTTLLIVLALVTYGGMTLIWWRLPPSSAPMESSSGGILSNTRKESKSIRKEAESQKNAENIPPKDNKPRSVRLETPANEPAHAVAKPTTPPAQPQTLLLKLTDVGTIRIHLRPDLSPESANYILQVVQAQPPGGPCPHCNFYRAEKPGILQGILAHPDVPHNTVRGPCPPGSEGVKNECPQWDSHCGCHGPVLTRGMVAWAGGDAGPDFFLDMYKSPADWWGTQHTAWGEITDVDSIQLIEGIWKLPTNEQSGMTYLQKSLHFDLALE